MSCHVMSWPLVLSLVLYFVLSLVLSFVLSCALLFAKVESKQDVLASSKRELEEERQLLERGKKEAATEAENLDRRREVMLCCMYEVLRCVSFYPQFAGSQHVCDGPLGFLAYTPPPRSNQLYSGPNSTSTNGKALC